MYFNRHLTQTEQWIYATDEKRESFNADDVEPGKKRLSAEMKPHTQARLS